MNEPDQAATIHDDSSTPSRRTPLVVGGCALLILLLLAIAVGIWMIPKGTIPGTRLVYEVDGSASAEDVAKPLRQRLQEIRNTRVEVQPTDAHQVEVLVASRDEATLEHARQLIESAGILRFLIVANPVDHATLIELATEEAHSETSDAKARDVDDQRGTTIGRWVTVSRRNDQHTRPLRVDITGGTVRRADTGEIVPLPSEFPEQDAKVGIAQWMDEQAIPAIDVLVAVDPELEVTGADLTFVASRLDQNGDPAVSFEVTDEASERFLALTTTNAPVGSRLRQLGIILDDVLLTAPVIRSPIAEAGQISGDFTYEEVDLIVGILKAGRLPAKLREVSGSATPVEMPAEFADLLK